MAARGILDEARRLSGDHPVVGTHGRAGVSHALLVSVAERVARGAPMAVTIEKATQA